MTTRIYEGGELELFRKAVRWKAYYARELRPYVGGEVLEVGAGIGGTTSHLCSGDERGWTCLEPDPDLLEKARQSVGPLLKEVPVRYEQGLVADLPAGARFDTILYIDVLEHIPDDAAELTAAMRHLTAGGYLVVLSPAHPTLYSEFDRAVGHCRRYTAKALRALTPSGACLTAVWYLDSIGAFLSLANRIFLRQSQPGVRQIAFWDRFVVPLSRLVDPMLGRVGGRSVIAVWKRE
jgi:SAM-dependent methyltransferase